MGDNGASAEGGLHGSDHNIFDMITGKGQETKGQIARMDKLGSAALDNYFVTTIL